MERQPAGGPAWRGRKPEAGDAPGISGLKPSLGLVKRGATRSLPWCPAGAGARPRATNARTQLAFAVRFLAAVFFIGAFFFATVFAFAAALAICHFPLLSLGSESISERVHHEQARLFC